MAAVNQELASQGWQVLVLTGGVQRELSTDETGTPVVTIKADPTQPGWFHKLSVWWQVCRQWRLFDKAEIVHVHDVMWWVLPLWPLIRKKLFMTFHGWEGEYPVPASHIWQRHLWSQLSRGSIHVGEWIAAFYVDQPDMVTYGGVSVPKKLIDKSIKKLDKNNIKVVFVGRLEQENEIEGYVEVVSRLRQEMGVTMTWVGGGSFEPLCAQIGTVTGTVDNIWPYLEEADLVLANSYLSMLEALSLGKTVLSLYSHPLKEAYLRSFPGAKYLLIADHPVPLAATVSELLNHPETLAELNLTARTWARQQTWSNVAKRYQELWTAKINPQTHQDESRK